MKYFTVILFLFLIVACSAQNKVTSISKNGAMDDKKVATCVACHGIDGRSGKAGVPSLSNRSYDELVAAMEGVRESYSPQPLLGHALSDKDIHEIAVYFSSI